MAQILDGKMLAKQIQEELKNKISEWVKIGHRTPSIYCIIVGSDPASHTYVKHKVKAATEVGIKAKTMEYEDTFTENELLSVIESLNRNKEVDGILVQLPLPNGIDERKVCNAVAPEKDVDGFHITNIGQLCLDMPTIVPATALAVIEMLKRFKIETFGRNAVVIGRSKNVGMPIAMMLHSDKNHDSGLGMDATVTICHRYTPADQLELHCRNADIIITATGPTIVSTAFGGLSQGVDVNATTFRLTLNSVLGGTSPSDYILRIPKLIKANMIKPGATVIDVGITRIQNAEGKSKLVGDVDFDEVVKVAGAVTPVPGGVGPMTVAMLMQNTFQAAQKLQNLN